MSVNIQDARDMMRMAITGERKVGIRSEEEIFAMIDHLLEAVDKLSNEEFCSKHQIPRDEAIGQIAAFMNELEALYWVCNIK